MKGANGVMVWLICILFLLLILAVLLSLSVRLQITAQAASELPHYIHMRLRITIGGFHIKTLTYPKTHSDQPAAAKWNPSRKQNKKKAGSRFKRYFTRKLKKIQKKTLYRTIKEQTSKIEVSHLQIYGALGLEDAAATAVSIGQCYGIIGIVLALIEDFFQVKQIQRVDIQPCYNELYMNFVFSCIARTKIANIMYAAIRLTINIMKGS